MSDFELAEFLPYQISVLANRISVDFSKTYREKFGISIPEWRVVAHLSQAEKVSIREIYRRVEMDKSKASRAAARLEKAGYITKKTNTGDRRLVELSLTVKGRAMMDEIAELAAQFENDVLNNLPPQSREAFRQAVKTLMHAQQTTLPATAKN